MRKFITLMAILGLALLMVAPALALNNEVVNGSFNSPFPGTSGWTNPADGHSPMTVFFLGSFYAGINGDTGSEGAISQVTNDMNGGGWNPNFNAKHWTLDLDAFVQGAAAGEVYLYYYNDNSGPEPALGDPDNPNAGWVPLVYGQIPAIGHYSWEGTIPDFQPLYFAVALEGQYYPFAGGGTIGFTNVDLEGECEAPVPPSVWLFGSGLLGLMGLRRKLFS
jgi:hypothetical protein